MKVSLEKVIKLKDSLNEKMTKEQLFDIVDQLFEEILMQADTIAQMEDEIDRLKFELDICDADRYLGI